MYWIGIDPGASGGLVCLPPSDSGSPTVFSSMPDTEQEVWDWLAAFKGYDCFAVIEQVQGYIGQPKDKGDGEKPIFQPGAAMFNFGWSYGGLRMALVGNGIEFVAVQPSVWQRRLGISPRRRTESKTAWKNRLKEEAQRRFPRLKVTLKTADALLIAAYCKEAYPEDANWRGTEDA